jgi:DNA repair protein RadC
MYPSGREGHLGAAAVALDNNLQVIESQQVQVGPMDRWLVQVAELIGIFHAVSTVYAALIMALQDPASRISDLNV